MPSIEGKASGADTGYGPPPQWVERSGEPVILETGESGFPQGSIDALIRAAVVDTLILAGVPLHASIRATAVAARQSGLNVWIADDAVASDDPLHAAITRRYLEELAVCFLTVERLGKLMHGEESCEKTRPADAIRSAIDLAANHAAAWCATELSQRAELVRGMITRLAADGRSLATLMTREIGKPVRFCRVEVERTRGDARRHSGAATVLDAEPAGPVILRRRPHGTVAIITPFNNPVYLPLGKIVPAMLYGNTVVWKPAAGSRPGVGARDQAPARGRLAGGVAEPGAGRSTRGTGARERFAD